MNEAPSVPDLLRDILADPARRQKLWEVFTSVHRRAPYLMEVEELQQAAFLRVLMAADQFRGSTESEFLAWVRAIARNCLMDSLRDSARHPPPIPFEEQLAAVVQLSSEELVDRKDLVERILASLTPFEAALLRAKYEGGLSSAQIACTLGQTPAAVRQLEHRLIERLRARFGRQGE